MLDLHEPLFKMKEVARIARCNEKSLANWIDRGIVPLETEAPGRGGYRLFSTRTTVVVALMTELTALGMAPLAAHAAIVAALDKHELSAFPADVFLVVTARQFESSDEEDYEARRTTPRFTVCEVKGGAGTTIWHHQVAQTIGAGGLERPLAATILQPGPLVHLVLAYGRRTAERRERQARRIGGARPR